MQSAQFTNQQENTFNNVLPDAIFTGYKGVIPAQLGQLGIIADPITGQAYNITDGLPEKFIKLDTGIFAERNLQCSKSSIDDLIANTGNIKNEIEGTMRCGWLYKPPINDMNPRAQISRGAYGTRDSPAITAPADAGAQWIWNLEDAKKRIDIDRCRALKSCDDVEHPSFIGCGFSKTLQRGIPVTENGQARYNDMHAFSVPSQIITKKSQCPPPPPVTILSDGYQPAPKQLSNGKLSRDYVMQRVLDAGCNKKGSLYAALDSGNSGNYSFGIDSNKAYQVYNSRAMLRGKEVLHQGMLRDGGVDAMTALENINGLQDVATSVANDGFAYAARDLCLNAGTIDKYDFCSEAEVPETTKTPGISLECLQVRFMKIGGTKNGSMYPTQNNYAYYNNNFTTLGDIIKMWRGRAEVAYKGRGEDAAKAHREIIGIPTSDAPLIR